MTFGYWLSFSLSLCVIYMCAYTSVCEHVERPGGYRYPSLSPCFIPLRMSLEFAISQGEGYWP